MGVGSFWIGNTCFAYRELAEYIGEEGRLIGAVAFGIADEEPEARLEKEAGGYCRVSCIIFL